MEAYRLEDAEQSYRQAIALEPGNADAYDSLAYFLYAVQDDAEAAIPLFENAIERGAGESAAIGLSDAKKK
jgi:Flp pilus assembly protein TadD